MKEYLICSAFWCVFTLILCAFGKAVKRDSKNISESLIWGYIVYSMLIAVVGVPMQVLNLPWLAFGVYVGMLWGGIIAYIIYAVKYKNVKLISENVGEYVKNNWIVWIILGILAVMMLFYYAGFWLGNHQDDGYYITKVATLPYSQIGGNFNYTVGVNGSGFNSYIVNTWELEASVYVKILGVAPTLFLRLFQSVFYYFLFLNAIKFLAEKLIDKTGTEEENRLAQYVVVFVPLICTYYLYLSNSGMLLIRDMFHLNTGMFLGGTVEKTLGVILFIIVYLNCEKSGNIKKLIIESIAVGIVLISKSAIALPVIIIVAFAGIIVWFWTEYEKKGKVVSLLCIAVYIGIGIIVPNHEAIENTVRGDIINTVHSKVLYPCMVIFMISFFLRNEIVYKLNVHFILIVAMIMIPECNDIFETCSVYSFVGGRAWSSVAYYFIILNMVYLGMILQKIHLKEYALKLVYILIGILCCSVMLSGFQKYGGEILPQEESKPADMKWCFSVMRHNIYFTPDSTIELGHKLEDIAKARNEKLYVIMPKAVIDNNAIHFLAVSIRTFAPDIVSLSALERFSGTDEKKYEGYTQQKYDGFVADPNENTYKVFKNEIKKLDADCIVTKNLNCGEWLEKDGYQYYTMVGEYYIWCVQ